VSPGALLILVINPAKVSLSSLASAVHSCAFLPEQASPSAGAFVSKICLQVRSKPSRVVSRSAMSHRCPGAVPSHRIEQGRRRVSRSLDDGVRHHCAAAPAHVHGIDRTMTLGLGLGLVAAKVVTKWAKNSDQKPSRCPARPEREASGCGLSIRGAPDRRPASQSGWSV
jgi:hypothetical protein